ncbi:MAG: hypothetical protein DRI90_16865, partial [Deltaproteobacteria bacterium]
MLRLGPIRPNLAAPMPRPQTIGVYEVDHRLEGQSREVYLARSVLQPGRDFVLALFEVAEGDRLALEKEVKHCMQVEHPALTRTVEAFAHEGKEVLVFESVMGASLHSLMIHLEQEGERLSDGAILHLGRALVEALEASHGATDERGKPLPLVHGQLSPYQVLIAWNGDVKLLGVGLSTIFRLAASNAQIPAEALPYQAPEVRHGGQVTTRANVYSAAALLWALFLQRTPPTDGTSRLESLVTARPDIPGAVAAALDQALEPSITKRTITCQKLAKAFAGSKDACDREDLKWNMEVFRALIKVDEIIPTHSLPPSTLSQAPPDSISVMPPDSLPPDSDSQPAPASEPISGPPDSFDAFYDLPTERHDFSKFRVTAPSTRRSHSPVPRPTLLGTGPSPLSKSSEARSSQGKGNKRQRPLETDVGWELPGDDEAEPSTKRRDETKAPAGHQGSRRKPPRKGAPSSPGKRSKPRTAADQSADAPDTKRVLERRSGRRPAPRPRKEPPRRGTGDSRLRSAPARAKQIDDSWEDELLAAEAEAARSEEVREVRPSDPDAEVASIDEVVEVRPSDPDAVVTPSDDIAEVAPIKTTSK